MAKVSFPPACGRQNQPTERKNGKKINLILPEHCHGDIDTCSWICLKKKCHKVLGYSFCKPRNAQAWREECQGMPRDVNGAVTISSLFQSPYGCPVLAEITEIIILHLSSSHLGTTLSSPSSHISWGGRAIKTFIHFLTYPLITRKSLIQRVVGGGGSSSTQTILRDHLE